MIWWVSSHKLTESVVILASQIWTSKLQGFENFADKKNGTWPPQVYCLRCAQTALLASIIVILYRGRVLGEQVRYWISSMQIYGTIALISNSNKRYTLCFIDDYNRRSWIYFLIEKSEALSHFKCIKKIVENETGFISSVCIQIGEASSPRLNSTISMSRMTLSDNW